MATLDRHKMPEPKSLIAALRLNAGSPSHLDVAEVLRIFAKDSVRVRLTVLSALLLSRLLLNVFALSARLATVVAVVLCASAIQQHARSLALLPPAAQCGLTRDIPQVNNLQRVFMWAEDLAQRPGPTPCPSAGRVVIGCGARADCSAARTSLGSVHGISLSNQCRANSFLTTSVPSIKMAMDFSFHEYLMGLPRTPL